LGRGLFSGTNFVAFYSFNVVLLVIFSIKALFFTANGSAMKKKGFRKSEKIPPRKREQFYLLGACLSLF